MFTTMRRKRRSTQMKNEIGQSVDHFKRAATLAAQETGATVGPKFYAARDKVQPTAVKAKDAATSGWDSALAALTPLVTAAAQSADTSKKALKANKKDAKKNAKKVEKRANKALGRKQSGSKASTLAGLALVGAAVGVAAAYVVRRRKAAQWDEYDPSAPIATTPPVSGAEDTAFEPANPTTGYTAPTTKD